MTAPKIATKYRIAGPTVLPFKQQEGSIVDSVPAGYYKVEFSPFTGFYLTRVSDTVVIPDEIFGSTLPRATRIFDAYDDAQATLGVGLFGKKGAGKTLLANVIANRAIARGIPVIDVSDSFTTDPAYLDFINSIAECVVIFDEFLKHLSKLDPNKPAEDIHDRVHQRKATANDRQDEMLTFFQGTHNTKRLIILIDNQTHMLSEFLTDRPGRMRYMYTYEGVEREVVEALAEHHGLTKTKAEQLVMYSIKCRVSFDVINEVIKEWVKYPNETLEQLTSVLNVPTLYPDVTTKVRIVSFTPEKEGYYSRASLVSELATMSTNGSVKLEIELPNELYNAPMMTKEEFKNSDFDYMSYEDYLERRTQPLEKREFRADNSDLMSIKGNQQMYKVDGVTFVIEVMETVTTYRSHVWANAL